MCLMVHYSYCATFVKGCATNEATACWYLLCAGVTLEKVQGHVGPSEGAAAAMTVALAQFAAVFLRGWKAMPFVEGPGPGRDGVIMLVKCKCWRPVADIIPFPRGGVKTEPI